MPYRNGGVPQRRVFFDDGPTLDAFGRLRVSEPETLFSSKLNLSTQPLFWEQTLTDDATSTHLPNLAAVRLTTTTTVTDAALRQSKIYIPYQPGKSQLLKITFVLNAAVANVTKYVGYGDDRNGIFLRQTSTGLAFVRRTYVSDTAAEEVVLQSAWNKDKLDGSGGTGITINQAYTQILWIDLEWLGVGDVRMGFVIDGAFIQAHTFHNTNVRSNVYMSSGSLPVRYQIINGGATAGSTLDCICAEVSSEGGQNIKAPIFAVTNGATTRVVSNALLPLISIKVGDVFPGGGTIVNRSVVDPVSVALFSEDASVNYQVIYNGALTDASWANFSTTQSGVQVDVAATAITGGTVLDAGFVSATNQSRGATLTDLRNSIELSLNTAGNAGDILTLAAIRIGNTNSDCSGVIQWREIY